MASRSEGLERAIRWACIGGIGGACVQVVTGLALKDVWYYRIMGTLGDPLAEAPHYDQIRIAAQVLWPLLSSILGGLVAGAIAGNGGPGRAMGAGLAGASIAAMIWLQAWGESNVAARGSTETRALVVAVFLTMPLAALVARWLRRRFLTGVRRLK